MSAAMGDQVFEPNIPDENPGEQRTVTDGHMPPDSNEVAGFLQSLDKEESQADRPRTTQVPKNVNQQSSAPGVNRHPLVGGVEDEETLSNKSRKFDLKLEDNEAKRRLLEGNEESGELKLLWDKWHHDVAKASNTEYKKLLKQNNSLIGGMRLSADLHITVFRNGHINAEITQSSYNNNFNMLCVQSYRSLQFKKVVNFPEKSQREKVEWVQTQAINEGTGGGFTWTRGDTETVQR